MKRFIEGVDRSQTTLFPDHLEDWVDDDNPVQVIDVFVDELDLFDMGFDQVAPKRTGRPAYVDQEGRQHRANRERARPLLLTHPDSL